MEFKTLARFKLSYSAPSKQNGIVFEHVAVAPNLLRFCASSNVGNLYLGDIPHDKVTALYKLESQVTTLSVMQKASGMIVALVLLANGSFLVIDSDSGVAVGFHAGFGYISNYVSIHPSSDRVITTSSIRSVAVIWDVRDDQLVPLQRLLPDKENLLLAQFSFDGNSIITWVTDGRVIIWDFPSLEFIRQLPILSESDISRFEYPLVASAISNHGHYLGAIGQLAKLILWDTTLGDEVRVTLIDLPEEFAYSKAIEFVDSGDNKSYNDDRSVKDPITIVSLGNDGFLRLFQPFNAVDENLVKRSKSSKSIRQYSRFVVQRDTNKCLIAAVCLDGSLDLLHVVHVNKRAKSRRSTAADEKRLVPHSPKSKRYPDIKISSPKTGDDKVDAAISKDMLKMESLEGILRDFGSFPAKHRSTIWNHVLQLPRNKEAYRTIVNRGIHPVFEKLEETFDVIDKDLLRSLKRILSAVCYWCSLFAQVTYLPLLIFPFVKIFRDDLLTCFEVIVTCLSNWCHDWFEYYPAPPLLVLADVDSLLADSCPNLLDHFKAKQVTAQIYAWPLLKSALSEVFTEDEWLTVWDHLILYKDRLAFLPAIVAAYAIVSRNSLLVCQREEDFQLYFRDKNPIPVKTLLEKAREFVDDKDEVRLLHDARRSFKPLPTETYPVFYNFPRASIEHQAREQTNLRKMAIECENQKKATEEAEAASGTILQLEQEMKRRDAVQAVAEMMRRKNIFEQEQRLAKERCRLRRLTGELRRRELLALEANQRRLVREKQIQENGSDDVDEILRLTSATTMALRRDAADNASARCHQLIKESYAQEADATNYSLKLKEARRRLAHAVFKNTNKEET